MVTFTTINHRQLSPKARDIVLESLLFTERQRRWQLFAACVMPDHVHILFEPQIKEQDPDGNPIFWSLTELMHSVKSFTAHEINKAENTTGGVWEKESFDRMMRSDADLEEKFHYICRNPWDASVVPVTEPYPWLWTPGADTGSARVPRAVSAVTPETSSSMISPDKLVETGFSAGRLEEHAGRVCSREQVQLDIAFRVIADHIRTLSFAIADGIQPGNNDRNYVLRRILRRAVRYGRTLGFKEPFFYKLVDVLVRTMGDVFPEIRAKQQQVKDTLKLEEEAFNKTLDRGIELFEDAVAKIPALQSVKTTDGNPVHASLSSDALSENDRQRRKMIAIDPKDDGSVVAYVAGDFAFVLYDTYGFPLDLTELMARERGLTVDKEGFEKLMEEQRARARAAQKKQVIELSQIETKTPTHFLGYDHNHTGADVQEVVQLKDKTVVVLNNSVCYAEMGGQVGDTGELSGSGQLWRIVNTQKSGNTVLHFIEGGDAPAIGSHVTVQFDLARRAAIQRHHTVTHLLHWALHEVASKEASQKGSSVTPEKLTFDFNSAPLTPTQVADIEKLVNERILENAGVSWTEVPHADVKNRKDVMQFFGDKYGDVVRVVQIGGKSHALDGYSMELCGGTHTRATGEIGLFRIVSEAAVSAGVRRIEAIAGLSAYASAKHDLEFLHKIAAKIGSPMIDLEKKLDGLLAQQKELERSLRTATARNASNAASELLGRVQTVNGVPLIAHNLGDTDGDFLQAVVDALKSRFQGVIVLGGGSDVSVALVAAVTPEFTKQAQAGKIIQTIAPIVGGKGGGKPDNARGGGKDVAKLDEALAKVKSLLG
jgi:alanyl-tRNA synthetase